MSSSGNDNGDGRFRLDFSRILAGGAWLILERILRIIAALVVGTWVARHLGPEQYGVLGYVAACFGFLAPIASLGIDQPALRALANGMPQGAVIATAVSLRLLAGCVLAVTAALALMHEHPAEPYPSVILPLAIGSVFAAADACEWPFQARLATRSPALARVVALCTAAAIRIFLLLTGAGVTAFAWVLACEMAMVGLGLAVAWRWQPERFRLEWNPSLAHEFLRAGWPLALSGLLIMSYSRIDQVMLEHLANTNEVGLYVAATRLSECWWLIPTAIATAATSSLVHAHTAGRSAYLDEAVRSFRLQSLLALPPVLVLSIGAPWIIPFMFGEQFEAAVPMLAITAWSGWLVAHGVTRSACLTASAAWRFSLLSTAIGAAGNIALNLLLIPRYGGIGAAIATLVAQWLSVHASTLLLGDGGDLWKAMSRGMLFMGPTRRPLDGGAPQER